MSKVYGYCRASTKRQETNGNELESPQK